jgi:hypothetical protein
VGKVEAWGWGLRRRGVVAGGMVEVVQGVTAEGRKVLRGAGAGAKGANPQWRSMAAVPWNAVAFATQAATVRQRLFLRLSDATFRGKIT